MLSVTKILLFCKTKKYIQTQKLQNHQRQVVNTEQGLDKNQNSFRNQKTQVLGEAKSFHEKL